MLTHEISTACRLAREAGAAIEAVRAEGFETHTKDDETPVTRADLAADTILRQGLLAAFPRDGLLSEESGHQHGSSERTWIIDPLDGTKGFIRDVEGYAVQIGLIDDDEPVLGVVYEPRHDRLYRAVQGGGAFLESRERGTEPLRVSSHSRYADMALVASTSLPVSVRERLVKELGLTGGRALRSVGTKVGHVVRQTADIYISPHPVHYWDSCGPLVVLREAGGVWTQGDGDAPTFDLTSEILAHPGPFVVSNGTQQADLCLEISRILDW